MEFKIECPWCHQHYSVDDSFVGQNVECSICGKQFAVRKPSVSTPVLKKISADSFSPQANVTNNVGSGNKKRLKHIIYITCGFAIFAVTAVILLFVFTSGEKTLQDKAESGNADAQYELGLAYEKGESVPKNYVEAIKMYHKAAEQGHAEAQFTLGRCYYNGIGVKIDYAEAVKWYRMVADQGYAEAQFNLGICYYNGYGVTKDYAEAVKWYRKAAELGDADAQLNLGACYATGIGIDLNPIEAAKWSRKAAEQGRAGAQFNLGKFYFNGYGVTKDYAEAVKWLHLATEQGHVEAKEMLPIAGLHLNAQNGDAKAQSLLGMLYESGEGVTKDIAKAVSLYQKAAEQGYAEAQYNLGRCYEKGLGVESDLVEAIKMYLKAAEQGHKDAKMVLTRLSPINISGETPSIKVVISKGESFALVKIGGGSFNMSAKEGRNEVPHQATLTKDFYIGLTEVTQSQWKAIMESNPSHFKGDDLPVEMVTWNEAMEFCEILNMAGKAPNGWRFTLPTETQWEYAAIGGKKSNGYIYSGSDIIDEVAWYHDNSYDRTHPVGQKKANELGLYDMSGNVCEWCLDNWQDKSDKLTAEFVRGNDLVGNRRAHRGGAYSRLGGICSSTSRDAGYIVDPYESTSTLYRRDQVGFRVVLVQDQ